MPLSSDMVFLDCKVHIKVLNCERERIPVERSVSTIESSELRSDSADVAERAEQRCGAKTVPVHPTRADGQRAEHHSGATFSSNTAQ
jgi:hypothetical protein